MTIIIANRHLTGYAWFDMEIEQVICWFCGCCLFFFAYKFINKDKISAAFLLIFLGAAFIFSGFSSVQSLIKTGLFHEVVSSLTAYGDKLNTFQLDVNRIRTELIGQQNSITNQQNQLREVQRQIQNEETNVVAQHLIISNQIVEISKIQIDIAQTQTNIEQQEAKLEDVQNLLKSLFARMIYEEVDASDTNRVIWLQTTNYCIYVIVKLKSVPIEGSLQIQVKDKGSFGEAQGIFSQVPRFENLIMPKICNFVKERTSLRIQYCKDVTATNFESEVHVDGSVVSSGNLRLDLSNLNEIKWQRTILSP